MLVLVGGRVAAECVWVYMYGYMGDCEYVGMRWIMCVWWSGCMCGLLWAVLVCGGVCVCGRVWVCWYVMECVYVVE